MAYHSFATQVLTLIATTLGIIVSLITIAKTMDSLFDGWVQRRLRSYAGYYDFKHSLDNVNDDLNSIRETQNDIKTTQEEIKDVNEDFRWVLLEGAKAHNEGKEVNMDITREHLHLDQEGRESIITDRDVDHGPPSGDPGTF